MIQRIQSIFIAGYILFSAFAMVLPLAEFGNAEQIITISATNITSNQALIKTYYLHYVIGILALASTLLGIRIFLLYKNRLQQMKLLRMGNFVAILLIGSMFFVIEHSRTFFFEKETPIAYGFGVYFPIAAIVMSIMANKYIKKDEDLVRSVDRIR